VATFLPCVAKFLIAKPFQIGVFHAFGAIPHAFQNFLFSTAHEHNDTVSGTIFNRKGLECGIQSGTISPMGSFMKNIAEKYGYQVAWSAEDDAYVARCNEMQGVAAHGDTAVAAMRNVMDAAMAAVECILEDEDVPPEPLNNFSGKFMVRVAPSLHRELAQRAKANRTSMNRLVASLLTDSLPHNGKRPKARPAQR
jgi:predicted HicB family RNase H-like nuclease